MVTGRKRIIDTNSGTIGPFWGRAPRQLNADERVVLKHFFTNIDSNVYAATSHMPNMIWALMMGQYARSDDSARERFLRLIQSTHEKNRKAPDVHRLADIIRSSGKVNRALGAAMEYAGRFIEEWGISYGHASLRDSDIIRLCVEGVTQRGAKHLETAREGAYQERSTRALRPTLDQLAIPPEIRRTRFEGRLRELTRGLLSCYDEVMERMPPFLERQFSHRRAEADAEIAGTLGPNAKLPDRKWKEVIDGKAFDVARYLIPSAMTTGLGITLNTRRFQDQLTTWQSSPQQEIRIIGGAAQCEAMKISPNLMPYGNASQYAKQVPGAIAAIYDTYVERLLGFPEHKPLYQHYDVSTKLVSITPDLEDLVLASIFFSAPQNTYSFEDLKRNASTLNSNERAEVAAALMANRGPRDPCPKQLEVGALVFERLYDIGAFRDMQRQRGDRQQTAPYNVVGYNMPPEIRDIGLEQEFVRLMHDVRQLHTEIAEEISPYAAEYVTVMANVIRHVTTKDPAQQIYEAPLRTQPSGIDSYRTIAQEETRVLLEQLPSFAPYVKCDWTPKYDLGRLPEAVQGYIRGQKKKAA